MPLPTSTATATATATADVLVPLTPLDAIMGGFGLTAMYVFPPPAAGRDAYDLERVHAALVATIENDYPHFVGRPVVDPLTGAVGVLQTPATRAAGARGIRFARDAECELTTREAVEQTPMAFLAPRENEQETLTLKATLLRDGGLVLGLEATHTLLDGEGMFTFFNVWSLHYRGAPASERPVVNHDRHLLMPRGTGSTMEHPEFVPPAKPLQPEASAGAAPAAPMQFPPTSQKPFHLTPAQLAKLKETVSKGLADGAYVSTIDIVTALFTVLITQARGHGKDVKITTGVNARSRFDPPLPPHYVGNCIFNALSTYTSDELLASVSAETVQRVARRIRASILRRDEPFLRDAIEFIARTDGKWAERKPSVEFFFGADFMFTSWANMGMYDADFGAGAPVYAGPPTLLCDGMVIVMDAMNHGTGLDVMPLLARTTAERLAQLWDACELLRV